VFPGFFLLQCVERYTGWTVLKVDCGEPRSIPPCIECACFDCCDSLLAASPIGTVLLNSYLDLSTRVCM
jgi:hypothetical protein